jgi:hypothetical protein
MKLRISLNPKHESDRITAFLDQISRYGHQIEIVFDKTDLIDPDKPVDIDNLPFRQHHLSFVDDVLYLDGERELYLPVNKQGLRKAND